jgi:hypothetical protein
MPTQEVATRGTQAGPHLIPIRDSGSQPPPAAITIAVDTEFRDTHTLTVQAAARLDGDTLAVQVYRSPAVPGLPAAFDHSRYLPADRYGRVVVRPVRALTPDLSPTGMVRDLCDLTDLTILSRREGSRLREQLGNSGSAVPTNVWQDRRSRRWKVPALRLTVVGHFLSADFCRLWGREFLAGLLQDGVRIRSRKLIQFADDSKKYGDPVLEYCCRGGDLYETRVQTRDTVLPFGHATLESLSKTFLGFGKHGTLAEQDKRDMLHTFQARTADAYGYAMADALNTLLVYERMQARDRDIYRSFGFPDEAIPPLRPTLGGRVSTFLLRATRREAGECDSLPSDRSLEALMRKGGMGLFTAHPDASRYGTQTAKVHGGLLYSRSPTRFWHASPGMLRDVDMAGCYQSISSGVSVYWGRPVVYESGRKPVTLKEAVDLVTRHADPDGWLIRVSGDLAGFANALLPSTDNAVTSANYRRKLRHGKRRQSQERAFHLEALRDPASVKGTGGSRLYASRVESGVVTWATWLLIRALPPRARRQYERLTADTVAVYPKWLAARHGREFDALVHKHRNADLPWQAELDLDGLELVQRERIDADFVTLRFPLGEYAERIGAFRKRAQGVEGKGSGADLAWKVHANTVYGVLGSSYLPTNNFVAGNVITAQARAEAFAMGQALNAIQTITDGCTYRLDQIPACTFAECLRLKPDYPVRRAEGGDGIPFLDPKTIPQDDGGFTDWYRGHVQRFFGVAGPEYDRLFGTHALEHKRTGTSQRVDFDALACDGASNYLKATQDGEGGWRVEGFAARSYGPESKRLLQDWLVRTYPADCLTDLPPITEDTDLLSFDQARRKAERALAGGVPAVVYPLRIPYRRVSAYRALKESAFVFETPEQRAAVLKQVQKFEQKTGAGLELLTLRRTYGGRRQGSLSDLAEELYSFIRGGGSNVHRLLNLNKLKGVLEEWAGRRAAEIQSRKDRAEGDLLTRIDVRRLDPANLATAYVLSTAEVAA